MVINFEIIQRDTNTDLSDENIKIKNMNIENINDIQDVLLTKADVQIFDVTQINPVKTDITKKLLFACNEIDCDGTVDVILIISNNEFVNKYLIYEAINNVSDNQELSKRVTRSLLNIETRLDEIVLLNIEERLNEIISHKTVCGIRNDTLIVDLSGPPENTKKSFEAVVDVILQTVNLIRIDKDKNISLHDVASTSSDYPTKQKHTKTIVKRKHSPPLDLPLFSDASTTKRHKESFPMISVTDALLKIRKVTSESKNEITFETVQLNDAYGRVLCENVESIYNLPPFRASTKHGYAVLAAERKGFRKLLQIEKNTFPPMSLQPGTCVWVNSGDPVPEEATAVVKVIDAKIRKAENDDVYIEIQVEPQFNENIKPIGYDLMKGKIVATPYTRIGPLEIGLLTASGRKEVLVAKNTPIGVLSIGSNLKEPGETLMPGFDVYDINRITLITLLKEKGFHSLDFGIVNNKMVPIVNKIDEALKKVDILVTTGSTNNRDLMKTILVEYYKADIHFGNVNIKPGKSTIFATCKIDNTKKYFWCLSGNPVSALIAARIFLLSFLNEMFFDFYSERALIPAYMKYEYVLHDRPRVTWTILDWIETEDYPSIYTKGNAISDKLVSAVGANALLMLPKKEEGKINPQSFLQALLVKIPNRFNKKSLIDHFRRDYSEDSDEDFDEDLYK